MKPTAKNTSLAPVLLAPSAGTLLRQNLRAMSRKYALLASEQQQEFSCHLAKRTAALSKSCKHLPLDMQGYLHQWRLLQVAPTAPTSRAARPLVIHTEGYESTIMNEPPFGVQTVSDEARAAPREEARSCT